MANEVDTRPGDTTITSLVTGIVSDAQTLMKHEVALAKQEMKEELRKTKEAFISLLIGGLLAAWGGVLLSFMLVHLVDSFSESVDLWGAFGIVGGLLAVLGTVLIFIGKGRAEDVNLVPDQTVETMKENVQWLKNPR